jgi:hypothetical protein
MFACWQGFVILTQILQFLLKYQFSTLTPWGRGKSVENGIKNGKAGIHICRRMAYPAKRGKAGLHICRRMAYPAERWAGE